MYYKELKKEKTVENGKTYIIISGKCVFSNETYEVKMEEKLYQLLEQGIEIGPLIGFDKMEFLISGICPETWDRMFKEKD